MTDATLIGVVRRATMTGVIDVDVLREGRAGYDQEIVATLSHQLTDRIGPGFVCTTRRDPARVDARLRGDS